MGAQLTGAWKKDGGYDGAGYFGATPTQQNRSRGRDNGRSAVHRVN